MATSILIPYLAPLTFVEVSPVQIPQYIGRHMEDYLKEQRLTSWEQMPDGPYVQPFLPVDVISLQIQNNAGQPILQIIDCHLTVYDTIPMTQRQQNKYRPEYYIYESNTALVNLANDIYYMMLKVGTGTAEKDMISQGFKVNGEQLNTLLIQYVNRTYYGEMIFETGITPSVRIQGILRYKTPASKDTLFEDQVLDMTMVRSRPYRLWELIIINVPDWMIDKLNWILGCSHVKIDGKYFTKNEGAKFEQADILGNGYKSAWKIELRESIQRGGKIIDGVADTNEELSIILNTTSKGFADTSEEGSSSIIQFLDVE